MIFFNGAARAILPDMIPSTLSTAEFFRSHSFRKIRNGALSLDANRQTLAAKPAQTWRRSPRKRMQRHSSCLRWRALANYRRLKTIEAESEARDLLEELNQFYKSAATAALPGDTVCDWQSRHFFAARGTPMICADCVCGARLIASSRHIP